MPVQGTASEIMKIAMIAIHSHLRNREYKTKMLLQVHDELIFECPADELNDLVELVSESMPSAMDLDVPLRVTVKSGVNWGDLEEMP